MAKVKDQIRDRSEVSYIDASGRTCYLDELFRHIMPDAYPLPSLNPTGVVKKSSRGHNGPTQGDGSPEQLPWRMCFQECSDRWNALPDECPAIGICPQQSSKKNVWDAKQAQGVMCSYFDLYMSCCMKSCTKISITGRDGSKVSGGTIGSTEGCWPCPSPCLESTLSIEYTTNQMSLGENQALSALDSVFGRSVPCCPEDGIEWKILSGKGSLSPSTGLVTIYTAPLDIEGCQDIPVIELSDCCGRSVDLTIYVTKQDVPQIAFGLGDGICVQQCVVGWPGCDGSAGYWRKYYDCFGDYIPGIDAWLTAGGSGPFFCAVSPPGCICCQEKIDAWCAANTHLADYIDLRSDAQKAAGCCPAPPE